MATQRVAEDSEENEDRLYKSCLCLGAITSNGLLINLGNNISSTLATDFLPPY